MTTTRYVPPPSGARQYAAVLTSRNSPGSRASDASKLSCARVVVVASATISTSGAASITRCLAKASLHFRVDVQERQRLARSRCCAELYVRPVLETLPMTARRQTKCLGFVGVHMVAVQSVDVLG